MTGGGRNSGVRAGMTGRGQKWRGEGRNGGVRAGMTGMGIFSPQLRNGLITPAVCGTIAAQPSHVRSRRRFAYHVIYNGPEFSVTRTAAPASWHDAPAVDRRVI